MTKYLGIQCVIVVVDEATSHTASILRKQSNECWSSALFLILIHSRTQVSEDMHPSFREALPSH